MKLTVKLNIAVIILIFSLIMMNMIISGCGDSDDASEKVGGVIGTAKEPGTDGAVLAGKYAEIWGINGTIGIGKQTTNVNGKFSFLNIPNGTYTVTITDTATDENGNNLFIGSKNVEIVAQETREITIERGEVAPPTPTPTATATPTPTP